MTVRKREGVGEVVVRRRAASKGPDVRDAKDPERRRGIHPEIDGPDAENEIDPDADVLLSGELTAQPSHIESDVGPPVPETGLSVDPEDLGRHALVDATQQDNFESLHEDGDVGIHVINPHLPELPD
jgi:hypothetical protein